MHAMNPQSDFNGLLRCLRGVDGSDLGLPEADVPWAEFPVSEYARRYARAIRLMEEKGLDALFLSQELNVRYFSGYLTILWESRFRSLMLLLPRDPNLGPTLVIPGSTRDPASSDATLEEAPPRIKSGVTSKE